MERVQFVWFICSSMLYWCYCEVVKFKLKYINIKFIPMKKKKRIQSITFHIFVFSCKNMNNILLFFFHSHYESTHKSCAECIHVPVSDWNENDPMHINFKIQHKHTEHRLYIHCAFRCGCVCVLHIFRFWAKNVHLFFSV